jgi:hypothetical protein
MSAFPSIPFRAAPLLAAALLAVSGGAQASSHREAPFVTTSPKVDATDFYMFNSYEPGRDGFVTMLANYVPLQDAYGGPNYFSMDPNALYEIHIDNNGDAKEDLTFQFRFKNTLAANGNGLTVAVGGQNVDIAPLQNGTVSQVSDPHLQIDESYTVTLVRGDRRSGARSTITNATNGATTFEKPVDNIGEKTTPNYASYAAKHVYTVNIPGCDTPGRVFVGQRQDPFAIALGIFFDQLDAPVPVITDATRFAAGTNILADKNVTTLALEVAAKCLKNSSGESVLGGWTTASLRQARVLDPTPKSGLQNTERSGGAWTQVSRLGMPLVNELVIGLKDKDRFNGAKPMNDSQFATYVTNPSFPTLLETWLALPGAAPTNFPRTDLVTAFLTGIKGVNQPANVVASEMLRLNTAIAAVPYAQQNRLGIVGNILAGGQDSAGYPNGRRPKDDVVDITMGGLCLANGTGNALALGAACNPTAVPLGATVFNLNDTVDQAANTFLPAFPYLNTPVPGTGLLAAKPAASNAASQ